MTQRRCDEKKKRNKRKARCQSASEALKITKWYVSSGEKRRGKSARSFSRLLNQPPPNKNGVVLEVLLSVCPTVVEGKRCGPISSSYASAFW